MAHIPKAILEKEKPIPGLELRGRGKVRNSYNLPNHPDKMLVVATKRLSAFDFVWNMEVPQKGEILTALNAFWVRDVLYNLFKTDLISCGSYIDDYLPEHLRGNIELQSTGTVVQLLKSPEIENVARMILTGSGWKSYKATGIVCGHKLPPGLINGIMLPFPIYTPTTKAEKGHDEPLDVNDVVKKYGFEQERITLQVMLMMADYAKKRGILLGDGKLEMIGDVLIDEKGTPDSCRFMDLKTYWREIAKGKLAPFLDKQFVRNYGIEKGIDKLDPTDPGALAFVDSLQVPDDIIRTTTAIYRYIFWRLTGAKIEVYQKTRMAIAVEPKKPRVEIVVGSESDLPQTDEGMSFLVGKATVNRTVLSVHRNYDEFPNFVRDVLAKADIVIAGAGMANHLSGMTKVGLCSIGHSDKPVIGAAFKGKTEKDDRAAALSIECLPGEPVELDHNGKAYFGTEGFLDACHAAVNHEFLPKGMEKKLPRFNVNELA